MYSILLLCGGPGGEHDVSLLSARNILDAIDMSEYHVDIVYIDKDKKRYYTDAFFVSLRPFVCDLSDAPQYGLEKQYDALFSIVHGTRGEDGVIQGLGRILAIPVIGCDVASSAICMDKDITKRLLDHAGLPIVPYICCTSHDVPDFHTVVSSLGLPFFVKPAQSGSSVGVSKVRTAIEYTQALADAFVYDIKVLIETSITGSEIECAILGNHDLIVSPLGQIINQTDFYSYDAKYNQADSIICEMPAILDPAVTLHIQDLARQVYRVLGCAGMARVDFFYTPAGDIYINEVNTIPGFTDISMYPKLIGLTGLSYPQIIDRLIQSALVPHI